MLRLTNKAIQFMIKSGIIINQIEKNIKRVRVYYKTSCYKVLNLQWKKCFGE